MVSKTKHIKTIHSQFISPPQSRKGRIQVVAVWTAPGSLTPPTFVVHICIALHVMTMQISSPWPKNLGHWLLPLQYKNLRKFSDNGIDLISLRVPSLKRKDARLSWNFIPEVPCLICRSQKSPGLFCQSCEVYSLLVLLNMLMTPIFCLWCVNMRSIFAAKTQR